jgi:signal transduction histidine kinase
MFYIRSKKLLSGHTFYMHLLPTGAVMLTLLGLTLLTWHNARQALNNERQAATTNLAAHTTSAIVDSLRTYEVVLKGAAGLFTASDRVTEQEWQHYIDGFDLPHTYPGVQGVGYAELLTPDQVAPFVREVQQTGRPGFKIYPDEKRDAYAPALYFVPQANSGELGFDMYSEPARRDAMKRAQASGAPTLTSKIQFVISDGRAGQPGFNIFYPVYSDASQMKRPVGNRQVRGFTFAPFTTQNAFQDILDESSTGKYAVSVIDTKAAEPDKLLYKSENFDKLASSSAPYRTRVPLELYGRQWLLDFRFSSGVISDTSRSRPVTALVSGLGLSLLLSSFVLALLMARTKALAQDQQTEVQSAKDELLSLASHQLRTPATAVKQYLGMMREGYSDPLTPNQQSLLDRAFSSNERQLHIINELLYVAKIDAKGIVLSRHKLNIGKLVGEVAQEVSDAAKERKHKIRVYLPSKPVLAEADEHCLRMAVENIIMNALKYSYNSTLVTVKVASHRTEISIAVTDKGVGISRDELPLLFQRFSRIPNELSQQTSGSGIGLYLSQQLIRLHGGVIEVDSSKGRGSTFTIHLPKKPPKKSR